LLQVAYFGEEGTELALGDTVFLSEFRRALGAPEGMDVEVKQAFFTILG